MTFLACRKLAGWGQREITVVGRLPIQDGRWFESLHSIWSPEPANINL